MKLYSKIESRSSLSFPANWCIVEATPTTDLHTYKSIVLQRTKHAMTANFATDFQDI